MSAALSQQIVDDKVRPQFVKGRGNGLFANGNIEANSQILFVARPLLVALDTAKLSTHCYYCYRASVDPVTLQEAEAGRPLKKCSGCKVVKFCDKKCQTPAWREYHKFECQLFKRLLPRVLPNPIRAVIRVLKQHQAGLVSDTEFRELLGLESHYGELLEAENKRLEEVSVMTMGVQGYSDTQHDHDTIMQLVCTMLVNSFTLTDSGFEPSGMVLHPRPARMNHSCEPNAVVRFDIPPTGPDTMTFPAYGGISVHALRAILKDEEITISYIDTTMPRAHRQEELKARYFFDCTCTLCSRGSNPLVDFYRLKPETKVLPGEKLDVSPAILKVGLQAEEYLLSLQSGKGDSQNKADVNAIQAVMNTLADTKCWPLYRYPWPQLRQELLLRLIAKSEWFEVAIHSAMLVRAVHPVLFAQEGPTHPLRLVQTWILINMLRLTALDLRTKKDKDNIVEFSACVLVCETYKLLNQGARINGQLEKEVDAAYEAVRSQSIMFQQYQAQPEEASAAAFQWLDGLIAQSLKAEGVAQDVIDLSFSRRGLLPRINQVA